MKYKFTLTTRIRGYVEWEIEHYHDNKKQLEEYREQVMPSCTTNYSEAQSSNRSETTDTTAKAAIKLATAPYIKTLEVSTKAVEKTLERCDKTDLELIDLVYWKRTHTITGAGAKVGLSVAQAYRRINNILVSVAMEMGIINPA